jgi:hypothetical protein
MRGLDKPSIDSFQLFKDIAQRSQSTRRTTLLATEEVIKSAYQEYEADSPYFATIEPDRNLTLDQKKHLHGAYKLKASSLRASLKDDLGSSVRSRCPACGISEPDSLDHALGKEEFPEYSLHAANLVPWCRGCNGKKGTVLRQHNCREFLHCYYDDINSFAFLRCTISDSQSSDTPPKLFFHVEKPEGMPERLFDIVRRHFKNLCLAERFLQRADECLSDYWDNQRTDPATPAALTKRLAECERLAGTNHWETAYYRALVEFDEQLREGLGI